MCQGRWWDTSRVGWIGWRLTTLRCCSFQVTVRCYARDMRFQSVASLLPPSVGGRPQCYGYEDRMDVQAAGRQQSSTDSLHIGKYNVRRRPFLRDLLMSPRRSFLVQCPMPFSFGYSTVPTSYQRIVHVFGRTAGGKTRVLAGPKSEGESYFFVAEHFDWWGQSELRARTTTEDFARDSLENLLFSICR